MAKRVLEIVENLEEAKRGLESQVLEYQGELSNLPRIPIMARNPVLRRELIRIKNLDRKYISTSDVSYVLRMLDEEYILVGRDNEEKVRKLTEDEVNILLNEVSSIFEILSREEELKKSIEENKSRAISLKNHIDILNQISQLESESPIVGKVQYTAGFMDRDFYTSHLANNIICLYLGDQVQFIATTRKDSPLRLETIVTDVGFSGPNLSLLNLLKVEEGNFITVNGYVLNAQQKEIAEHIFDHVKTGKKILPTYEFPEGYRIMIKKTGKADITKEIRYRHWGQQYLGRLGPDNVIDGQLLGSGGSYKAFRFGNTTVVEFDQDERATYLFKTDYFNGLRIWERSRILTEMPEGFNGRIIHRKDRNNWKKQINDFLNI